MKIIGHRGASGLGKENSLEAIAAAIKAGVDGIEFDIHCTKDNQLVLHHDGNITGKSGPSILIKDVSLKELKGALPTFSEAAKFVLKNRKLELFIDAKGDKWAAVLTRELISLEAEGFDLNRCFVISFWLKELGEFVKILPKIKTIPLFSIKRMPFWVFWFIARRKLGAYAIGIEHSKVIGRLIKFCHSRGVKVYYYTIDDPIKAVRYMQEGLDYLATDRPDLIKKAIKPTR